MLIPPAIPVISPTTAPSPSPIVPAAACATLTAATVAGPYSGYRLAPWGSTSYWNNSNSTPSSKPVHTSPSIAPAIDPATSGRAIIICGTLTKSSPTSVPHPSSSSCSSRLT